MKFATVSKPLVMGLALLLASSAFAATKGSLQISNAVTVNGTTLKPGDYKLQWEGSGPNVEVSIMQGKNVIAKAPAHIVDLDKPSDNDAAVTRTDESGSRSLTGVRFHGKKFAPELAESHDAIQAGASK